MITPRPLAIGVQSFDVLATVTGVPRLLQRSHHGAQSGFSCRTVRSCAAAGSSLLWIDDEIGDEDATVKILEFEGFSVDVARSAADGLAAALTKKYLVIILDLRLPDMDGLKVLQRLRAAAASAPIIVFSGFLDVELAGAAVRLGARDVRQKPLFADDLIGAITEVVEWPHGRSSESGTTSGAGGDRNLLARMAIELTRGELSPAEFLTMARRFRWLAEIHPAQQRDVSRCMNALDDRNANERARLLDSILECVAHDLAAHHIPTIADTAAAVHRSPEDVHEILGRALPGGFRACRRALRIRPALAAVALMEEQYAQIAYRVGYEHPTQFAHDFRSTLGLTPHHFRVVAKLPREVH